jgi:hypothetical protein
MTTSDNDQQSDKLGRGSRAGLGLALLAGAAAVFVVCALAQSAAGSSMFSSSYPADDSLIQSLLANVTFYPGWLATLALGGYGALFVVSSFFDAEN